MAEEKAAAKAPEPEPLIIIRRLHGEDDDHHGGVWKIALADFMTALMAFFLIMWLINSTDEETKEAIATYFNPIVLADSPTDRKGLQDPQESAGPDGPHEGEPGFENRTSTPPADPAADRRAATLAAQEIATLERAAYQDPYAILAELARLIDPTLPTRPDAPDYAQGVIGTEAGDTERDPFDPVYWQTVTTHPSLTLRPGDPGTVGRRPDDVPLDARARRPVGDGEATLDPGATGTGVAVNALLPDAAPVAAGTAEALSGGGTAQASGGPGSTGVEGNPSDAAGPDVRGADTWGGAGEPDAEAEARNREERIRTAAERIVAELAARGVGDVEVTATPEGVLISLTDDADFSMFPVGSAVPRPGLLDLMGRIAGALNGVEGQVVVRGHTDGRPFRSETYDNWRLSTARAHMAQYMLVSNGLPSQRVAAVEGFADRRLKDTGDPFAAVNRRIEILIAPTDAEMLP